MPQFKQHIATKNKAKKALLFLALLLSIFTFSGGISIAQQNTSFTQSEWVLPADGITKSAVGYSRITRSKHHKQYSFISQHIQFAIAIAGFNRAVATRQMQQSTSAVPKQQQFLQTHNHIPTATEPPHQA
nr:hypothetical protein [Mucilaginibacter sp. L294]